MVVSSTAFKMVATDGKCALPMFIANHATKPFTLLIIGKHTFYLG